MTRGKTVEIATRIFENQTKAFDFFRSILNKYRVGSSVDHEDSLELHALLRRHPEYIEKTGSGIDHFAVMKTGYGSKCFQIIRVDGTWTDFSISTCVKGCLNSRKDNVSRAFREIVRDDLLNARRKFFAENQDENSKVMCGKTKELVKSYQAHMDHVPPLTFSVIITSFLVGRGLDFEQVPLLIGPNEQTPPTITDPELVSAFRSYHNTIAKLEIVKKKINLSQSSRNRIKDGRISLKNDA